MECPECDAETEPFRTAFHLLLVRCENGHFYWFGFHGFQKYEGRPSTDGIIDMEAEYQAYRRAQEINAEQNKNRDDGKQVILRT